MCLPSVAPLCGRSAPRDGAAGRRCGTAPLRQAALRPRLNEHYLQIFSLTRLDEAIGIHDTEAAAIAAAV